MAQQGIHLDLDGAWEAGTLALQTVDLRAWGPRVRYCTGRDALARLDNELPDELPPFVLYGSGDFHHLASLFVGRAVLSGGLSLVSFDNHPDWDIRPPHWSCGAWVSRALELPEVEGVDVWGCGNFELHWPSRLFANHRQLRRGRLRVHPWADRMNDSARRRFRCISAGDWRDSFEEFAQGLADHRVYITVDLDCLRAEEAATNWENGLFTADDVAWAVGRLREVARVVGGDVCGAYSVPEYAGVFQRFAGNWDHPKMQTRTDGARVNAWSLAKIWAAMVG